MELGVLLAEVLFFLALSEEADFDRVRTPFKPFIVSENRRVIVARVFEGE